MGKRIHWDVCKKNKIQVKEKWYEHEPAPVTENEQCTILWDFNVQTDHVIEARRPDMIIIDKVNLGTTPRNICKRMEDIGIKTTKLELQKTTIIHYARILRKVLEI